MPGIALVFPSVFTIERSPWSVIVSITVDVLLLGFGSVTPAGGDTVTVFSRLPVAPAGSVPDSVKITDSPAVNESPGVAVQIPRIGS